MYRSWTGDVLEEAFSILNKKTVSFSDDKDGKEAKELLYGQYSVVSNESEQQPKKDGGFRQTTKLQGHLLGSHK